MLTVTTASIPGREHHLAAAVASTVQEGVDAHLVCRKERSTPPQVACADAHNRMLRSVQTCWVQRLDDDNLWMPHHMATVAPILREYAAGGIDVLYTYAKGLPAEQKDCNEWTQQRLIAELSEKNFLDGSGAIVRTDTLRRVGGWPTDWWRDRFVSGGWGEGKDYEDWELWRRLALSGCKFRCVPMETWVYQVGDWPRILNTWHVPEGGPV